jgi:hypothetical protein
MKKTVFGIGLLLSGIIGITGTLIAKAMSTLTISALNSCYGSGYAFFLWIFSLLSLFGLFIAISDNAREIKQSFSNFAHWYKRGG